MICNILICISTFCSYLKEYNNTLSQRRHPVRQIMPLPRLKSYLTAGRAVEFDTTTTENNTMSIQIQTWYKYKYFTTGRAGEFETANETPDQTNVTFYMTQCIVHFNSTQYLNLVNNTFKIYLRPLTRSMHEIQRLTMSRLR